MNEVNESERLWNAQYWKVMTCNFMMFFAFYLPGAAAAFISRQRVCRRQGHHRDSIVGLCGGHFSGAALQWVHSGCVQPQASADGVSRRILYMLHRVSRSRHAADVRDSAHDARHTVRGRYGGQLHCSYRRASFLTAQRGNRLLWPEQQPRHGDCSVRRHLYLQLYRQFQSPLLAVAGNSFCGFALFRYSEDSCQRDRKEKPKLDLDHFFLTRAWLMAINICLFGLCWGVMSNYVALYAEEKLSA